jgi:secondary thiamine-phosphate synthase enzyme
MIAQQVFSIATRGRGSYPLTDRIQPVVQQAGIRTGICHVFLQHTSASLMLCENADPDVRADLERFMSRHVQDGDPLFTHVEEGPDDMSAHVRTILTHSDLTMPVRDGRVALGVWQGIYLWEHRYTGQQRKVMITVIGE